MNVSHHEVGNRIDDNDLGVEVLDELVDAQKMHFEAALRWTPCLEAQKPFFHVLLKVNTYRSHVTRRLRGRFFKRDIKRLAPVGARPGNETRAEAGFSRACGTAN